MARANFRTEIVGLERWSSLPVKHERLAPRFRTLPLDELRVRWFDVIARPT
jgi:hypothetical protein